MQRVIFLSLAFCLILSYVSLAQSPFKIFDEEKEKYIYRWSSELLYFYAQCSYSEFALRNNITILTSINDPYYSSSNSWGQGYDDMWGWKKIDIENAWKLSTGDGALVAVLDSGIDYNHVDINGNIWRNETELNGVAGVDDDGNGYVDDIRGWDFYYRDADPSDLYGHGSHVAGIIGAEGNNAEGIIGVSYNAKIMPVKILNDSGRSSYLDRVAEGIRYAANMGAKILNCSFGGGYSTVMVEAFEYAYDMGCIIIASAGNSGGAINTYPAKLDYTVTVGSIGEDNIRSYFSCYGSKLDVVAPGEDILSLRAEGTDAYGDGLHFVPTGDTDALYYWANGTSMAAPFVSGLAALMVSQTPALTYEDFIRRLRFSSDDLGSPGRDNYYGWGRIDAFEALSHDWYDSGIEKTWWLIEPDQYDVIRYDYYESSNIKSRWLDSPDGDNVIRYDHYESGNVRSKWLDSPDSLNAIKYDFYESSCVETKWLDSPDEKGIIAYTYYNDIFHPGNARIYSEQDEEGVTKYYYAYICGTNLELMVYQRELSDIFGGGTLFFYYDRGLKTKVSAKIDFDTGDTAQTCVLSEGNLRITKFDYNSTTGNTAWFLWNASGEFPAHTVLERVKSGAVYNWYSYSFLPDENNTLDSYVDPNTWSDKQSINIPNPSVLPEELDDWIQYSVENEEIFIEYPPLSSECVLDNEFRVIQRNDHNPYMDTCYTYAWDYLTAGQMKMTVSYDYDKDGDNDFILSNTYINGSDYNLLNINTWRLVSKVNYLTGVSIIYTYFDSGRIESKTYTAADQYGNLYYFYHDEPFFTDILGKEYGRLHKQVYADSMGTGNAGGCEYEYYEGTANIHLKYDYEKADYSDPSNLILSDRCAIYEYDENGRFIRETYESGFKAGHTYTYEWDVPVAGQMRKREWFDYDSDGENELCKESIYENGFDYNISNISKWTCIFSASYWDGAMHEHDELGRLVKGTFPSGAYYTIDYYGDSANRRLYRYFNSSHVLQYEIEYWEEYPNIRRYRRDYSPTGSVRIYTEYDKYDKMTKEIIYGLPNYVVEVYLYYESGKYKTKFLRYGDEFKNIYYQYLDESGYYDQHGRLDRQIRWQRDPDGAIAYEYRYYSSTEKVKNKYCYKEADYSGFLDGSDLSDVIFTNLLFIYHYYEDSGRLKQKDLAAPENGNKAYKYRNEAFYNAGKDNEYGRMSWIYKENGTRLEYREYWGNADKVKRVKEYNSSWQLVTTCLYYETSGRLQQKDFSIPDAEGNKTLKYHDEAFYNIGQPGEYGRISWIYKTDGTKLEYKEYWGSTDKVKRVKEYNSSWQLVATCHYYEDTGRLKQKDLITPENGDKTYKYYNEAFYNTGQPNEYGRISWIYKEDGTKLEHKEYWLDPVTSAPTDHKKRVKEYNSSGALIATHNYDFDGNLLLDGEALQKLELEQKMASLFKDRLTGEMAGNKDPVIPLE